ncbi:MAG: phage portal protein, partial [Gemmatimonadales bacterium]
MIARLLPTWQVGRPLPAPTDFATYAREAYRRNPLVFACILELAQSVAEPRLIVEAEQAGETWAPVPPTHPLRRLLAQPNPEESTAELLTALIVHLQVGGNGYLHKRRNGVQQPVELWLLRPDRTAPVVGEDGMLTRWEYTVPGRPMAPVVPGDLVHVKAAPDPLDDYHGLAPLAVAARIVDLDSSAIDYLRGFFLNAGVPAGILSFKTRVPPEERKRQKDQWREEYQGLRMPSRSLDGGGWADWIGGGGGSEIGGWHALAVLDAGAEYKELGSRPEKLRMTAIWEASETRICQVFGVPPILVGAWVGLERSTFANYAEARRSFWEETLSPLYRYLGDVLTRGLAREFGDRLRVRFDLTTVMALQEDADRRRAWSVKLWDSGLGSLNEARAVA